MNVTRSIAPDVKAVATIAREQVARVLLAIDHVKHAREEACAKDLSEAGEYLALERLRQVESHAIELILAPDFLKFQHHLLSELAALAEGEHVQKEQR